MSVRVLAVSAPPRVRDWLAAAPDGDVEVLHRGRHAAYVELSGPAGRRCVGVVGTAAPTLPCALRLATPELGALRGDAAYVAAGVLHLDGVALRIGRLLGVRVATRGLGVLAGRAAGEAPSRAGRKASPSRRGRPGGATSRHWTTDRSLVAAIGRGPGLTPEADDVLVGWLAVQRAAGRATPALDAAVLGALDRTTLLSATLLECALHGEVLGQLRRWIAEIGTAGEEVAAARLAGVGHTSGAAMLRGGRIALAHLGAGTGCAA